MPRVRIFLPLLALTLVAGCSSVPTGDPNPTSSSTISAAPEAAASPSPSPATSTPACDNAVASFRPLSPMPQPGSKGSNSMPAGSYMNTIQKRGRLIVGVSADTYSFGARNPLTGKIEGFDIDMLHQVAKAIFGDANAIEYRVITYAQRLPSLQNGSVDIVAHTMTINCKRWQTISFSSEYYHAGQKILVPKGSAFKSIKDLSGKKVCAAKGSTNIDNLAKYPKVIPVGVDDLTDCMVAFQQGTVDAVTGDDTVLVGFAAQDPYADVVGDAFTDEPYGLGVAKTHPEFAQFVNGVLAQIRQDGTWAQIYSTWVSTKVPPPPTPDYSRPL